MVGVLIGAGVWMVLAVLAAIVLGRVAKRGDSEELGSTENWDTSTLDQHVHHDK